jgi:hypothetical protein
LQTRPEPTIVGKSQLSAASALAQIICKSHSRGGQIDCKAHFLIDLSGGPAQTL